MAGSTKSHGIHRRFISFIRRKLNHPSGTEVPIEGGTIWKKNGFVGSEIVVEFRHEDTKLKPIRHIKPPLRVDPNINQKSEEFIESRKKAMKESLEQERINDSPDQEKS